MFQAVLVDFRAFQGDFIDLQEVLWGFKGDSKGERGVHIRHQGPFKIFQGSSKVSEALQGIPRSTEDLMDVSTRWF